MDALSSEGGAAHGADAAFAEEQSTKAEDRASQFCRPTQYLVVTGGVEEHRVAKRVAEYQCSTRRMASMRLQPAHAPVEGHPPPPTGQLLT